MKLYVLDTNLLDDHRLFQQYLSTVSAERQEKVNQFRFQKDKNLSLAAGLLLDKGLCAYGLREKDMVCSANPQGKPYLLEYPKIHFNLSHSGTLAIAAFSEHEVGCDVEQISKIELTIAQNYFFADEYAFILGQGNPESQRNAFFRLWALKESFMKAVGLGFSLPLDAFCVEISGVEISVRHTVNAQTYHFREYDVGPGYKMAVCSPETITGDGVSWVGL